MRMSKSILFLLCILFFVTSVKAEGNTQESQTKDPATVVSNSPTQELIAKAGNLTDTRSLEGAFNGLKLDILLFGDVLDKAQGVKVTVTRAIDDLEHDLIKKDKFIKMDEFKKMSSDMAGKSKVEVNLKNPPRKAMFIKELQADVEIYIPSADPAATFKLEHFMDKLGKPIAMDDQVSIVVFDKKAYEEMQKDSQQQTPQPDSSAQTQSVTKDMTNTFGNVFKGMFGVGNMDERSIAVRLNDPNSKIIEIDFFTADGQPITRQGWFSSSQGSDKMQTFMFQNTMPVDAYLVVSLKTDKALKKTIIKLTDISLP